MRGDVQPRAIRAIGNEPLIDLGGGEGDRDARLAREGDDEKPEQAVEFVHQPPFLHALIHRSYSTGTTPPCWSTSTPDGSR